MVYSEICNSNVILFEELELLTTQIDFCITHNIEQDLVELTQRKEAVRDLIDINLDRLEEYWQVMDTNIRSIKRTDQLFTGKDQKIIDMFKENYNTPVQVIAKANGVSIDQVNRVLTRYISLKHA